MGNSLSDQLLKAGLASKKQARKADQARKRKEKLQRHNKQATTDESTRLAQQAMEKQAHRDRELNRQKQRAAEQKAITAQIRQLIELNRLDRERADTSYQFTDGPTIRQILVTDKMRQQLLQGQLAIIRFDDGYEIIPATVADKIHQRDEQAVVQRNTPQASSDPTDPYADYPVPDDLMW